MAPRRSTGLRIGVISDTHNLLRPAAKEFLRGCALIIHGGDICSAALLDELGAIAPVTPVRGNNDRGAWAQALPLTQRIDVGGAAIYVVHDLKDLGIDPAAERIQLVVSGHSHRPAITQRDGVTFLNPGSAGPRRFKLPISLAEIMVDAGVATPRLVELRG